MCGIVAVSVNAGRNAAPELVEALHLLQHRGQDSCGIALLNEKSQTLHRRGKGLVSDVFRDVNGDHMGPSVHSMGIGHLRYRTSGTLSEKEIQPLVSNAPSRISMVHNGNLSNTHQLGAYSSSPNNASLDTEILLNILTVALVTLSPGELHVDTIATALESIYLLCQGAFSCAAMIADFGLVCFRDKSARLHFLQYCVCSVLTGHGIKPLVLGIRETERGSLEYMVSSESVAFEQLGFTLLRDIAPGEAVFLQKMPQQPRATFATRQIVPMASYTPDIFEYVYFARPESTIDGISVYQSRKQMGAALARTIKTSLSLKELGDIDSIIAVPETSSVCAIAVAQELKKPYVTGITRNRHILRTFIEHGHEKRLKSISRKLNLIKEEFENRNVLIVDDSIVRGSTSKIIVKLARQAGARKIYLASCSPAIRYRHIYGIDLADPEELVAYNRTNVEIAEELGCDGLVYLSLDELVSSCIKARRRRLISAFETGLFSGTYVANVSAATCLREADHMNQERLPDTIQGTLRESVQGTSQMQTFWDAPKLVTA